MQLIRRLLFRSPVLSPASCQPPHGLGKVEIPVGLPWLNRQVDPVPWLAFHRDYRGRPKARIQTVW